MPVSDRKMVRPSGFEPPTFCSGGRNSRRIRDLAIGTYRRIGVAPIGDNLLVSNGLDGAQIGRKTPGLTMPSSGSVRGVGTALGTARHGDALRDSRDVWDIGELLAVE